MIKLLLGVFYKHMASLSHRLMQFRPDRGWASGLILLPRPSSFLDSSPSAEPNSGQPPLPRGPDCHRVCTLLSADCTVPLSHAHRSCQRLYTYTVCAHAHTHHTHRTSYTSCRIAVVLSRTPRQLGLGFGTSAAVHPDQPAPVTIRHNRRHGTQASVVRSVFLAKLRQILL